MDAAAVDQDAAAALLLGLAEQAGLRRPIEIANKPAFIDAHLMLAGNQRLVILTNNSA